MKQLHLAITSGDPDGIGPEIIAKSLEQLDESAQISLYCDRHVFDHYSVSIPESVTCIPVDPDYKVNPGLCSAAGGRYSMRSLERAVADAKNGSIHAIVTAPISKEAVNLAGWRIPGHTEWLAAQFNAEVMMILAGDAIRVAMVTGHIPLRRVSAAVTPASVTSAIVRFNSALKSEFGIQNPRIAVFGLNPHAGDGGVLGSEEQEIITPAILNLQKQGILCAGPYASDGFFGQRHYLLFDGVLAMYHDQGLTAFKALQFGNGVNITAGLPVVRTSPDHGTAFDIAGKNLADPSSFLCAINLAISNGTLRFLTP